TQSRLATSLQYSQKPNSRSILAWLRWLATAVEVVVVAVDMVVAVEAAVVDVVASHRPTLLQWAAIVVG
ncbi:hypothetical protein LTR16_007309, partial [Cryomyces antarcticus]